MSIVSPIIDLTHDEVNHAVSAAKRPIELLSESSEDERAPKALKCRRRGFRRKWSLDDVVIIERINLVEDSKIPAKSPLLRIIDVFPDVCQEHAEQLLLREANNCTAVLQILADSAQYPKVPRNTNAAKAKTQSLVAHRHEGLAFAYDFMSESSFDTDNTYRSQAKLLLYQDFPFLRARVIDALLLKSKQHYAICYDKICKAVMSFENTTVKDADELELVQFTMLRRRRSGLILALNPEQLNCLSVEARMQTNEICMRSKRPRQEMKVTNEILKEELQYVQTKQRELASRMDSYQTRRDARRLAEETCSTIECNCCYTDVSADEMVQCQAGHLFCCTCLQKMCETQIYANGNFGIHPITKEPATEMLCMAGCGAGFFGEQLSKWLTKQTLQKYNEMQFQAAVCKAQIEDLCSCPKCGFQAELPATEMIFRCPVGDCAFESCRKCGEEPHIPLKCDEVEKQTQRSCRLKVEEAISQTKIRTCPKPRCMKKFVKESGCNKMTCSCGTNSCYVCRKIITPQEGYTHFCQTPNCNHSKCGKCILYSNAEEDDKKAMRAAGIKAAQEVCAEGLIEKNAVSVSVDAILKMPTSTVGATLSKIRAHPTVNQPLVRPNHPIGANDYLAPPRRNRGEPLHRRNHNAPKRPYMPPYLR